MARLSGTRVVDALYLAGGTAVALHLAHRASVDLDLFSRRPDLDLDGVLAALSADDVDVVSQTDATLRIRVEGVPVDVVRYPYPPIDAPEDLAVGVGVASLDDLAAMKLLAISRRGLRRDFWDLYEILHAGRTLVGALGGYQRRFGRDASDLYPVIRSLTWFADAERDPILPRGLTEARWEAIRAFFVEAAPPLLRSV